MAHKKTESCSDMMRGTPWHSEVAASVSGSSTTINRLVEGDVNQATFFQDMQDEAAALVWVLRFVTFAMFWLGEYANILLMCALNAILFFGGWLPPFDWAPLYYIPGIIWLLLKIFFFFFLFSWVMGTVPRYRYDQLMRLGWKVFLPLSLVFVVLISGWLMATRYAA